MNKSESEDVLCWCKSKLDSPWVGFTGPIFCDNCRNGMVIEEDNTVRPLYDNNVWSPA
jgi:hypothetical protein